MNNLKDILPKTIWTAKQLEAALNIKVDANLKGGKIQFNSQAVKQGDIFIALKGANSDGHNYVEEALKKGANIAIISDTSFKFQANNILLVPDCLLALKKLAAFKRVNSKAKFIGVTGSVGKTSTKEALGVVLQVFGKTFTSRGNFNNELGIAINLASMADDIDYAVIEMGMNRSGEIRELTKQVKPDIAIITSISEGHLEFFGSVAEIASSKAEIFEGLDKQGHAIIPADNEYYNFLEKQLQKLGISKIHSFASENSADAMMNSYKIVNNKAEIEYLLDDERLNIILPMLSKHQALNLTISLLVVKILGLDIKTAINQFKAIEIGAGRGKIVNITKGNKIFSIIGDYYNANPESSKAALGYLQAIDHPNKVAILGDMLELGEKSFQLHASLVPYIKNANIKKLFLIGPAMASLAKLIDKTIIEVKLYNNVQQAIIDIEDLLDDDELILIKGSRGIALDKIVAHLETTIQNIKNDRFSK